MNLKQRITFTVTLEVEYFFLINHLVLWAI